MFWLVTGVLLWSGAHLLPSAGRPARERLLAVLGVPAYKGLFALTIVGSVVLMVEGWSTASAISLYPGAAWGRLATNLGMFAALLLLAASALPTNLRRLVRHPQLTGVAVWAAAHLLANGEERSLVLFGGIGLWALIAMGFISRRDGAWKKPAPRPITADLILAAAATAAFAGLFLLHPYFTGMPAAPH